MAWQETEHNWIIPVLFLHGKILLFVKAPSDVPEISGGVQVRTGGRILWFSLKV